MTTSDFIDLTLTYIFRSVVAVHGLCGSRETTWTSTQESGKKVMWLTDLLPGYMRDPKIMTYDYKLGGEERYLSEPDIAKRARDLLELLCAEQEDSDRPLMFIGQDVGGTIIQVVCIAPLIFLC